MQLLARDVSLLKTLVSNAYFIGTAQCWVLIDSLAPGHVRTIKQAAAARFGENSRPQAIVLTHGHIDHAGSAAELADFWNVKIYAHRLEHPFLEGRSSYPPLDHTTPGFFSALSRVMPSSAPNLGHRVAELNPSQPLPWLPDWHCYFTPGHSPGHVAFFRPEDAVLLAGDAVITVNLNSFTDTITQRQQVCPPPAPGTIDWQQARASVQSLAALQPALLAAGHGEPIFGAARELQHLANDFPLPAHGRYVDEPAITDANGIKYLPPAPFDFTPKLLGAAALFAVGSALLRKRKRQRHDAA